MVVPNQAARLTKLPLMHEEFLRDLPAHPDDIHFEWPQEADMTQLLKQNEGIVPTINSVTFQKPYVVYGLHWVLSNGVSSPMFNSHPDDPNALIRKSPPEHVARIAGKRIIRVNFAVQRQPARNEPGREEVKVTGVRLHDGVKHWPLIEFVRGDPIGTWDSQEVPEGHTLIGFHGILSKHIVASDEYHQADDGSLRLARIGLILTKDTP